MSKKFVQIYAVFAILVFIASIAATGARILYSRSRNSQAASDDFEALKGFVAAAYSWGGDFNSDSFKTEIKGRFRKSPSLMLIFIYNQGLGPDYVLPASSPYIVSKPGGNDSWTGYPSLSFPVFSIEKQSSPLSLPGRVGTRIDTLYTILPSEEIFLPIRDSLIALAAFVLLTCIVMIAKAVGERRAPAYTAREAEESGREYFDEAKSGEEGGTGPEDEYIPRIGEENLPYSAKEEVSPQIFDEPPPEEDYLIPEMKIEDTVSDELDAIPLEAQAGMAEKSEELQELESPERLEERAREMGSEASNARPSEQGRTGGPVGLFSPYSGLGWESYLEDRLQAELSRAASFEQDLVLIIVTMEGLTKESEIYHAIAESVLQFFSFRDLSFEFRDTGFAVVLPNIDLDHGMRMSEEFLKKITFRLTEFRNPLDYLSLFIGISSRAGRLIEARRILEEASRALEKAAAEKDTHIVAFRPNPDKYRDYVSTR